METILEKLQLITDKISNLDDRMVSMEQKVQKKIKLPKTKNVKDISNVHIFPFDEASEFVKVVLIENDKKTSEFYPVVEFLKIDFQKLANLVVNSEVLSVQWSDFTHSESVAKFENNQYILCQ